MSRVREKKGGGEKKITQRRVGTSPRVIGESQKRKRPSCATLGSCAALAEMQSLFKESRMMKKTRGEGRRIQMHWLGT